MRTNLRSSFPVKHPVQERMAITHFGATALDAQRGYSWRAAPNLIIFCFLALVAGSLLAGVDQPLNWIYPAAAVAVAGILYWISPPHYLGFVWWLIFLSAGVRRVVDLHGGWNWASPITLTPLLAAAVSLLSLRFILNRRNSSYLLPLSFIAVAIFYGYCVGLQEAGFLAASYAAFVWLLPALFFYHVVCYYDYFLEFKEMLLKTFVWGAFVMGSYGLYQYFSLPSWDANWLIKSQIFGQMLSGGLPMPYYVRVFSTMNAPAPFASTMMASLLLMISMSSRVRWLAAPPALISLLLSIVRTAWVGFGVGWLYVLIRSRGTAHIRQLAVAAVVICLTIPFLAVDSISQMVSRRFDSIVRISDDSSYRARNMIYERISEQVFGNFVGNGLGVSGTATKLNNQGATGEHGDMDSGLLEIPYNLGWPGGLLFVVGTGWLVVLGLRPIMTVDRNWTVAAGSIVVAALAELPLTNSIFGSIGMIFWCFLGMLLAEQRYVTSQREPEPYRRMGSG